VVGETSTPAGAHQCPAQPGGRSPRAVDAGPGRDAGPL